MRRLHNTNVVFVHIPKNAGQAITNCFGLEHLPSDHSLTAKQDLVYLKAPFIRFAVVRDPASRFVSAYKYQCHMQNINSDKVTIRALISSEGLDRNINDFVKYIVDNGIDLNLDMWFRRQVYWLRASTPQIILRLENLETDLEIVRSLVPEHFEGLSFVNASKGRMKSDAATATLNEHSLRYIRKFYERDFFYLSYPRPNISSDM